MELVQEIHQVLMDREDTCIRTCFSLQIDGVTLDNFAELKSIEGLKEGSVIKVVEGRLLQPYQKLLWCRCKSIWENIQSVLDLKKKKPIKCNDIRSNKMLTSILLYSITRGVYNTNDILHVVTI